VGSRNKATARGCFLYAAGCLYWDRLTFRGFKGEITESRRTCIFGIDRFFSSLQNAALKSLEVSAEKVLLDFQTQRTWGRPKRDMIGKKAAGLAPDL
jgi:hypothetical protein